MTPPHQLYSLRQIETPRLLIRPLQLDDTIPLNDVIQHSAAVLQQWQTWAQDTRLATTRTFVERSVFAWASGCICDFQMILFHKADQAVIGCVAYNDRSHTHDGVYEIGYWCDIDYHGQGLVTEATSALTHYALDALKASRVEIRANITNKKSIAVAQRCGYRLSDTAQRESIDIVAGQPKTDYRYICDNRSSLPSLAIEYSHYSDPSPIPSLITWAKSQLGISDNATLLGSRVIVKTPWSCVLEINTGESTVYLKHTPTALAIEAHVIDALKQALNAPVATCIATHPSLPAFLMKNAGTSLRTSLKRHFDAHQYSQAIEQFSQLQLDSSAHLSMLFQLGVPDWRLKKPPHLIDELLSDTGLLIEDGLTLSDIQRLKEQGPTIHSLCQQLQQQGIPEGLVQCDFHDNNILFSEQHNRFIFIDLGEIVISHPFFSLTNCLYQANKHHGITEDHPYYHLLLNAALRPLADLAPPSDLHTALHLAKQLHPLYSALAYHRLMLACGPSILTAYYGRGRLRDTLKRFLTM